VPETAQQPKGDMLDGLIVGLDVLCRFVGTKKYRKRVFLITDGEKETRYSMGELREIVETITRNDIKLNCITLDFCNELAEESDDEEKISKPKETGETEAQQKNKKFLMDLQEKTNCAIIPVETAIEIYA
jgi:1,4-dihydroxy-2-naphthoyl-CoA synthase